MAVSKSTSVYKPSYEMLQTELASIDQNEKLIYECKGDTISEIETKKLTLRHLTDSNNMYAYFKKTGKKLEKPRSPFFSSVAREKMISDLDRDISLIQHQYDLIHNELKELKIDLEGRLKVVEKTELTMNILNYKMYEIHYNFRKKLEELREIKENIDAASPGGSETQVAVHKVEVDVEIQDCQQMYEDQVHSVKEQKLEAQKLYEDAVNILDDDLQLMRKHYNILLLIIEAEKAQLSDSQCELLEVKCALITTDLQKEIDTFTEMQTVGWKTKQTQRMTEILQERGLKFTDSGLLVSDSGRQINVQEAREMRLLDDLNLSVDIFRKESVEGTGSKLSKAGSDYSRMTSEDVQYLKENVGTPLTLALAEITAVQPRDPIHYLAHWLFKYRHNQEMSELQKIEFDQLNAERNRLARERWLKFIEEEARAAVLEMIFRAEEEAMRNEIIRIQRELEALENEEAEENLDDEARDKFDTYDEFD